MTHKVSEPTITDAEREALRACEDAVNHAEDLLEAVYRFAPKGDPTVPKYRDLEGAWMDVMLAEKELVQARLNRMLPHQTDVIALAFWPERFHDE